MLILGKDTMKDPSLGYARTFVRQLEDCLGLALERGVQDRQQRRRPQPRRAGRPAARGRPRAGPRPGDRPRRGRRRARRSSVRRRADRQRLPRRLRHRRRPDRRRRRRRHRPGHRRLAGRRAGGRAPRLVARAVRRAGRCGRGGPRARVRRPGHRRQLLRLRRPRPAARPLGFPLAEIAADGVERHHQARRHRRRGHRRHRHRPAGLRDPVDPLPRPRRHRRPRLDRAGATPGPDRVAVSGVRGEAPPDRLKVCVNELGGCRNTVELVLTGLDVEAKAAWVREQLTAALDPAPAEVVWSPVAQPAARRRHRGGRVGAAAVHRQGPASRSRSAGRSPPRRSSSRSRPTPASR